MNAESPTPRDRQREPRGDLVRDERDRDEGEDERERPPPLRSLRAPRLPHLAE
jgi:hypothetical protein